MTFTSICQIRIIYNPGSFAVILSDITHSDGGMTSTGTQLGIAIPYVHIAAGRRTTLVSNHGCYGPRDGKDLGSGVGGGVYRGHGAKAPPHSAHGIVHRL